jgi:hypothetical protein
MEKVINQVKHLWTDHKKIVIGAIIGVVVLIIVIT